MADSPSVVHPIAHSVARRRRRVLLLVFAACLLVQVGDAALHPPHWLVTTLDTVLVAAGVLYVLMDNRRSPRRDEPEPPAGMH